MRGKRHWKKQFTGVDPLDFSPGLLRIQAQPPTPFARILRAEVWVGNQDVGFIHTGEPVKIKFAAYQFQKYGMVEGEVAHLSADASDNNQQQQQANNKPTTSQQQANNKPTTSQQQANNKTGSNLPFAYRAL